MSIFFKPEYAVLAVLTVPSMSSDAMFHEEDNHLQMTLPEKNKTSDLRSIINKNYSDL